MKLWEVAYEDCDGDLIGSMQVYDDTRKEALERVAMILDPESYACMRAFEDPSVIPSYYRQSHRNAEAAYVPKVRKSCL